MSRAGKFRHRVVLQKPTAGSADSYGEQTDTWSRVATLWAEVRSLNGTERYRAATVCPEASVMVSLRYRSDVTPDKRFTYGTRTIHPLYVEHDPRHTETVCWCKELV